MSTVVRGALAAARARQEEARRNRARVLEEKRRLEAEQEAALRNFAINAVIFGYWRRDEVPANPALRRIAVASWPSMADMYAEKRAAVRKRVRLSTQVRAHRRKQRRGKA